MIRVHIAIASDVMLAGLEALLRENPEIEIVNSASDANVLVRDDVPEISEANNSAPAVVLTDDFSIHDVWRSGARAILPRDAPGAQIIAAIYATSAGLVVFPAEDTATMLPTPVEQPAEPLTAREMEVIEMLAEGLPNKLIAHKLAISEHTAKFHVNSILAKLNAGTRTEAVMRGVRLGLVKI